MAGMKRITRKFLRDIAVSLVGLLVTFLVLHRFGWLGVLALYPLCLVVFILWLAVRKAWRGRGAIK
jgi:Ca2+/Na+ antiporter